VSSGPLRIAWLKDSFPSAPGVHSTDVSPTVSTAPRYGWTIAVRPAPCRSAMWRAARPACAGIAYRPVCWLLTLIVGLITHSPSVGGVQAAPGGR
jgi:hypothetical protein